MRNRPDVASSFHQTRKLIIVALMKKVFENWYIESPLSRLKTRVKFVEDFAKESEQTNSIGSSELGELNSFAGS